MKKIFLLPILLSMLLGVNQVSAQKATEKLTGVLWVLQNPEIASQLEAIFFLDDGKLLYKRTNITEKNSPTIEHSGTWKIADEKKGHILLEISSTRILACFSVDGNSLLITEIPDCQTFFFSKNRTSADQYVSMAAIAIQQYGENATLKNGGLPGPPFQGASYFVR